MKNLSNTLTANVGISGASLFFNDKTVIKRSFDPRLIKSAQKQINFNQGLIKTPHISKYGIISNHGHRNEYHVEMERIHGIDCINYFNHATKKQIDYFIDSLINYLQILKSKQTSKSDCSLSIIKKLNDLLPNSAHKDIILSLIKNPYIDDKISTGYCHGDLTLSNIIIKDKTLYLIDFLDCFIESFWMDVVKLRQDFYYNYVLLYNGIESVRLLDIFRYMNEKLFEYFKEEISSNTFRILEIINILRIEPYISKDKKWIIREMLIKNPLI